ncbi:hypothetical protein ACOSP7_028723 [Xanthoceras sorbifolium]
MNWTSNYLQHYIVVNLPATVAPSLHIFAARWTAPAVDSQQMEGCFSVAIAEALGVLRRLQFACDSGLLPAILETDSQVVV